MVSPFLVMGPDDLQVDLQAGSPAMLRTLWNKAYAKRILADAAVKTLTGLGIEPEPLDFDPVQRAIRATGKGKLSAFETRELMAATLGKVRTASVIAARSPGATPWCKVCSAKEDTVHHRLFDNCEESQGTESWGHVSDLSNALLEQLMNR